MGGLVTTARFPGGIMTNNRLTTTVRKVDAATSIVDIHGEVNAQAEAALMDAYAQASGNGTRSIILNFNGLDYMNSSGIGLLVMLLVRVKRQNQRLLAFGLSDHYRQIFELTRLNEAITIYPGEPEALRGASL
jgi:anti-sigma B factor antagonist